MATTKLNRKDLKSDFWKSLLWSIHAENQRRLDNDPEEVKRIERELFELHTPVEGLTHSRGYFFMAPNNVYIQYIMEFTVMDPTAAKKFGLLGKRLYEVIIYDTFAEYEADRQKEMSKVQDQTGLNYN